MNTFWTFLLFGLVSASCVELENLCLSDSFDYKDVRVNSFQRLRLNVTFEPLTHYLIRPTVHCNLFQFQNKTNFWEALKLKNKYNRKVAELYTEELSGATGKEHVENAKEIREVIWWHLRRIYLKEKKAECLKSFEETAYSGVALFLTLRDFFQFNLHPTISEAAFKPTESETNRMLDEMIGNFNENTDGPTFAFGSQSALLVLDRKILLAREFKFKSVDTKSMLTYELFLPFQNKNPDNGRCVPVGDLPLFYKNKGKK